jgi:hypothetical protein
VTLYLTGGTYRCAACGEVKPLVVNENVCPECAPACGVSPPPVHGCETHQEWLRRVNQENGRKGAREAQRVMAARRERQRRRSFGNDWFWTMGPAVSDSCGGTDGGSCE